MSINVYHKTNLINDYVQSIDGIPFIDCNSDYSAKVNYLNLVLKNNFPYTLALDDDFYITFTSNAITTPIYTGFISDIDVNSDDLTTSIQVSNYLLYLQTKTIAPNVLKKSILDDYKTGSEISAIFGWYAIGSYNILAASAFTSGWSVGDYFYFTEVENNDDENVEIPYYKIFVVNAINDPVSGSISFTDYNGGKFNNVPSSVGDLDVKIQKVNKTTLNASNYHFHKGGSNRDTYKLNYLIDKIFTDAGLTLSLSDINASSYGTMQIGTSDALDTPLTTEVLFQDIEIDELSLFLQGSFSSQYQLYNQTSYKSFFDFIQDCSKIWDFFILPTDRKTFKLVHIPEAYYTKVDGTTWSKQVNKQYSKYKDYSIKLMTRFYINDMYDNVDLSSDFDKGKRQFGTSENIIEYPEYLYFLHEDWLTSYELTTSTDLAWNKITANMVNVLELISYTPTYPFSILDNEFNNFVNPIDHVKYNHNIFLSSNVPLIKRCFENYITFNNKSQVWSVNE